MGIELNIFFDNFQLGPGQTFYQQNEQDLHWKFTSGV